MAEVLIAWIRFLKSLQLKEPEIVETIHQSFGYCEDINVLLLKRFIGPENINFSESNSSACWPLKRTCEKLGIVRVLEIQKENINFFED